MAEMAAMVAMADRAEKAERAKRARDCREGGDGAEGREGQEGGAVIANARSGTGGPLFRCTVLPAAPAPMDNHTSMAEGWAWTISSVHETVQDIWDVVNEGMQGCTCDCSTDANLIFVHLEELANVLEQIAIQSGEWHKVAHGDIEEEDTHSSAPSSMQYPCDYEPEDDDGGGSYEKTWFLPTG